MVQEHVLAILPKGPASLAAHHYAADVYSSRGPGRKKRSELAIAIDGYGTNIYDIRSSKLVTSYAVSPLASFTCPPCSLRRQAAPSAAESRVTYCSSITSKPTLHCFRQSSIHNISTSTFEIKGSNSRIVHLDTFTDSNNEGDASNTYLLAVHEDGQIRCFSEDLQRELWATSILSGGGYKSSQETLQVKYASITSLEKARKTILRGREDLLTAIESRQANPSILVLLTRATGSTDKTMKFQLLCIGTSDAGSTEFIGEPSKALSSLLTTIIPESSHTTKETAQLSFHVASGSIYQTDGPTLRVYSVKGMIAQLERDVYLGHHRASSCLRISPSLIADAAASSIFTFDLNYSSIQHQHLSGSPAEASTPTPNQKRKKKSRKEPAQSNIRLLSYFHNLDVVVALKGRHLLTFQFDNTVAQTYSSSMRKRKRDGLLINSIGCGSVSTKKRKTRLASSKLSVGRPLKGYNQSNEWQKRKALLEDHLARGEQAKFDSLVSLELQLDVPVDQSKDSKFNKFDRRKIDYLLSRIFSVEKNPTSALESSIKTLKVSNYFPNVCDYLIREGLFANHEVETALRHEGLLSFDDGLDATAVCEALAKHDPSLRTVISLIHSPAPLTAKDIACALHISLRQSTDRGVQHDTKLLTFGEDKSLLGNDGAVYKDTLSPPPHAENQKSTHEIFLTAIRRLYGCPMKSVSAALTELLSRSDMQHLIDMLRLELARNGWLASYIDNGLHMTVEDRPDSAQVSIIAHILNSVIDAIGTAGWLLGSWAGEDLTETANTLSYMNAEISAALEGIEEATYLKSMIGEMLICGKHFGSIKTKSSHQLTSKISTKPRQSAIVSLGYREESALPLGLKPSQTISTHKVGAGGELIRRSARDIGRLKSKLVPKYSFERIRF